MWNGLVKAIGIVLLVLIGTAAGHGAEPRQRTFLPEDASGEAIEKSLTVEAAAGQEVSIAVPVTFRLNSAELTPQAVALLRRIATVLGSEKLKGDRFAIEGHTDASGSTDYNRALSERRAVSVYSFLVEQGIDIARLNAVGYGESRLLPGMAATDGRNRRVEIVRRGAR